MQGGEVAIATGDHLLVSKYVDGTFSVPIRRDYALRRVGELALGRGSGYTLLSGFDNQFSVIPDNAQQAERVLAMHSAFLGVWQRYRGKWLIGGQSSYWDGCKPYLEIWDECEKTSVALGLLPCSSPADGRSGVMDMLVHRDQLFISLDLGLLRVDLGSESLVVPDRLSLINSIWPDGPKFGSARLAAYEGHLVVAAGRDVGVIRVCE